MLLCNGTENFDGKRVCKLLQASIGLEMHDTADLESTMQVASSVPITEMKCKYRNPNSP